MTGSRIKRVEYNHATFISNTFSTSMMNTGKKIKELETGGGI